MFFNVLKGALFVVMSAFAFTSCEEIVEINLKENLPVIVIESFITNGNGPFTVKITRSQSYFNQGDFTGIENAEVTLSDKDVTEKLFEKGNGNYSTRRIRGTQGKEYKLTIKTEGREYFSSVTIPPPVSIDTVYFQPGLLNKDSLSAFIQFCDPVRQENFYRIKVYRNGMHTVKDYYLINDAFTDGQTLLAPFYRKNFAPGDTVVFELCNLEKSTWKYLKGISEILDQGGNLQAPGNPPSNFSGGALGNFGAWGKTTFKIIVPGS